MFNEKFRRIELMALILRIFSCMGMYYFANCFTGLLSEIYKLIESIPSPIILLQQLHEYVQELKVHHVFV